MCPNFMYCFHANLLQHSFICLYLLAMYYMGNWGSNYDYMLLVLFINHMLWNLEVAEGKCQQVRDLIWSLCYRYIICYWLNHCWWCLPVSFLLVLICLNFSSRVHVNLLLWVRVMLPFKKKKKTWYILLFVLSNSYGQTCCIGDVIWIAYFLFMNSNLWK